MRKIPSIDRSNHAWTNISKRKIFTWVTDYRGSACRETLYCYLCSEDRAWCRSGRTRPFLELFSPLLFVRRNRPFSWWWPQEPEVDRALSIRRTTAPIPTRSLPLKLTSNVTNGLPSFYRNIEIQLTRRT